MLFVSRLVRCSNGRNFLIGDNSQSMRQENHSTGNCRILSRRLSSMAICQSVCLFFSPLQRVETFVLDIVIALRCDKDADELVVHGNLLLLSPAMRCSSTYRSQAQLQLRVSIVSTNTFCDANLREKGTSACVVLYGFVSLFGRRNDRADTQTYRHTNVVAKKMSFVIYRRWAIWRNQC